MAHHTESPSGLGPGRFTKSHKMMAQARPILTIGTKNQAQAQPRGMVGSGLAREFWAGPGYPWSGILNTLNRGVLCSKIGPVGLPKGGKLQSLGIKLSLAH
jgi:hypothetical protein